MTTIEILKASAREIQQKADEHQRLISAVIGTPEIPKIVDACHLLDCPHRRELKALLLEAITVLEETRRAFKSKHLEALRKKMVQALADKT
jgi:hypothetical protein